MIRPSARGSQTLLIPASKRTSLAQWISPWGIRQETLTTNDDDDETEEAEELKLERVRRPEVRAEFPQSLKEDGPRRNLVLVFVFVVLLRLGSDRDDGDGRRATGDYVRESECEGEDQ